jgi:hypothetical protein
MLHNQLKSESTLVWVHKNLASMEEFAENYDA